MRRRSARRPGASRACSTRLETIACSRRWSSASSPSSTRWRAVPRRRSSSSGKAAACSTSSTTSKTGCTGGTPRRPELLAGDRAGAEQDWTAAIAYFRNRGPRAEAFARSDTVLQLASFYCDEGRWDEAAELLASGTTPGRQVLAWASGGSRSRRAWRRTAARSPRRWRWPSAQSRLARPCGAGPNLSGEVLAGARRGAASSGKRPGGRRRGGEGARALRAEGQRRRRRTRAGTHRSSMKPAILYCAFARL